MIRITAKTYRQWDFELLYISVEYILFKSVLFSVPRVVAVSPQMRLVEDNPSSLSLVEIYKQRCAKKGIEHDNPISRYYDRLATVQARGTQASHQVCHE